MAFALCDGAALDRFLVGVSCARATTPAGTYHVSLGPAEDRGRPPRHLAERVGRGGCGPGAPIGTTACSRSRSRDFYRRDGAVALRV